MFLVITQSSDGLLFIELHMVEYIEIIYFSNGGS